MQAYIIRRLLLMIPTMVIITLTVFLTARFIPGNVIELMIAQMGAEGAVANIDLTVEYIKKLLGLDLPIHIQYLRWVSSVFLHGDFGTSLWTGEDIGQALLDKVPISIELGLLSFITAEAIAFPLGIYSALRQDSLNDYVGRSFAIVALSIPAFWLGTMVMVYPSIWWNWMPNIEYVPIQKDFGANIAQFLIPAFIMGLSTTGTTMRMIRTMMLEVMRQDYIRTAWSKGLTERAVVWRHALKNALIPVITIIGMRVPILISGSVVMEQIFGLPGIGRFMIEALNKRDYPIISGINLVVSVMVLFSNLVVDITYGWFDPRVQYK